LTRDSPNGTYVSHIFYLQRLGQYGRLYALLSSYRDLDPYCVSHFGAADSLDVKKKASPIGFIYSMLCYNRPVALRKPGATLAVSDDQSSSVCQTCWFDGNKRPSMQFGYKNIYNTNFDGIQQLFTGYVTSSVISPTPKPVYGGGYTAPSVISLLDSLLSSICSCDCFAVTLSVACPTHAWLVPPVQVTCLFRKRWAKLWKMRRPKLTCSILCTLTCFQ
jgi:hypothetical protein